MSLVSTKVSGKFFLVIENIVVRALIASGMVAATNNHTLSRKGEFLVGNWLCKSKPAC